MKVTLTRRNQQTGSTIQLIDNRDGSFEDMGEGYDAAHTRQLARDGAWATLCDTHGNYCLHSRRDVATAMMTVPTEWCEDCSAGLGTWADPLDDEYDRAEAALDYTPARDLNHILDVLIGG